MMTVITIKASARPMPGKSPARNSIAVGTVTTGAPNSSAQVTNSGTDTEAVFDFVIPRGRPGTGGGGFDFVCDLFRFLGVKIHRDLDAVAFDIDSHHAQIGRADLKIGGNIAFLVDTHAAGAFRWWWAWRTLWRMLLQVRLTQGDQQRDLQK